MVYSQIFRPSEKAFMHVEPPVAASYPEDDTIPWYKTLTGYQWFVFIVCCLAWDMDCMDQQLFVLARRPAMTELVREGASPTIRACPELARRQLETESERQADADARGARPPSRTPTSATAAGWATSIFMLGWAIGGIAFGVMGDRVGRVKTLMLTILLYAIFTGLSALSRSTLDFYLYRFLTGLGVGGVFAAAVTLLAETMPDRVADPSRSGCSRRPAPWATAPRRASASASAGPSTTIGSPARSCSALSS